MYVFVGGAAGVDTGSEAFQALMATGLRSMLNASVCHASIHDQGVRQHWLQLSCGVYAIADISALEVRLGYI
jgi:hypothetical protein